MPLIKLESGSGMPFAFGFSPELFIAGPGGKVGKVDSAGGCVIPAGSGVTWPGL